MNKSVIILDTPETCSECYFRGLNQELSVGVNLYKKISRCVFAPDDIEDPYRDIVWQLHHKEEWCPLRPYEEE